MIQLKRLSFKYQDTKGTSLENINLTINKGEFILITGESGCGKTTLTRILNGLCPQFFQGEVQGEYLLEGKNALELDLNEIGLHIGNVFQDPRSQFFTTNTTDEIVMAMESHNYPLSLMKERVEEMKQLFQLDRLLNRNIFQLSSGEKQKIAIAAACAVHPEIVVLDEPSANLDAIGTEQLARCLKKMQSKGVTIVVSEHRLHYLSHLIDRMVVMEDGKIKKIYSKQEIYQLDQKQLVQMGLRLLKIPDMERVRSENQMPVILEASNITFSYKKNHILQGANLKLKQGKITVITGRNGTGKSTLIKIISGILRENSGNVFIGGKATRRKCRLKNSFFVGQDADYQLYTETVLNEVILNMKFYETLAEDAKAILYKLNLLAFQDRHPASLSGGQKQRVLLAAALLRKRPLLVLDEPTSGLDGRHMRIIANILKKVAIAGTSVLLITHDLEFIQMIADEVLYMNEGVLSNIE